MVAGAGSRQARRLQAKRRRWRRAGRCFECGQALTPPQGHCAACQQASRQRYARRRQHGRCVQCGGVSPEGRARCAPCRAVQRAARAAKQHAEG